MKRRNPTLKIEISEKVLRAKDDEKTIKNTRKKLSG
jgi:hypothetical protein